MSSDQPEVAPDAQSPLHSPQRSTVRIGLLGAARIAPKAIVAPAQRNESAQITRVSARDMNRAESFAAEHRIAGVSGSYEELLSADDVDLVYIALPAALHHEWTLKAIEAGKHVLVEKPIASNAAEATVMVKAAQDAGRVLVEGFHYPYHPLTERWRAVARSGVIGDILTLHARFATPILNPTDIRHNVSLGGGATMDLGCYPLHWMRLLMETEPEVTSAVAIEKTPGIDLTMNAEMRFGEHVRGTMHTSMAADADRGAQLHVTGTNGTMTVTNPIAPQLGNEIRVATSAGTTTETVDAGMTFDHQLAAVVDAIRMTDNTGTMATLRTGGADSVANMALIDAVYGAAGMSPRGT